MAGIRLRSTLAPLATLLGVSAIAYLGLYGFSWSDYELEAQRPIEALIHGDFTRFAALAPPYGGSLLLRAPFALIPSLWSGGSLAIYRALAAPCLLSAAALAVWLCAKMRRAGARPLARAVALALIVCNPVLLPILEIGHPEEALCAVLCVTAVLLAGKRRALLAGLALGIAIGCKYWPIVALGPVLLALPERRLRCLVAVASGAAALLLPIALASRGFVSVTSSAASPPSAIFQPWQIFWFFGVHGHTVHALFGAARPGYRTAPSWAASLSHPLLIGLALGAATALWWRRRPTTTGIREASRAASISISDALLLLAFVMLIRCLFDTLDNVCYTLPLIFAVLVWECSAGGDYGLRRPPVVALCVTALCWINFEVAGLFGSADGEAAFFIAWTVPLTFVLALRLYAPSLDVRRIFTRRDLPSATSLSG